MNYHDTEHAGDREISPAATNLRSWNAAGLKVLHDHLFAMQSIAVSDQFFFN
jgi:hypothetical protein